MGIKRPGEGPLGPSGTHRRDDSKFFLQPQ